MHSFPAPSKLACDLTTVELLALQGLAKTLDPATCFMASRDLSLDPPEAWRPLSGRDAPPATPRPLSLWPLPLRNLSYGEDEAQTAREEGVLLLRHAATGECGLAPPPASAPEEAAALARAYLLLGYLPPFPLVEGLLEAPPSVPTWRDVALAYACQRTLLALEDHTHALVHGLRGWRSRLEDEREIAACRLAPQPARV